MSHHNEDWWKIWRKTNLWFGKWHEEYGQLSPELLKVSKVGFQWDPLIQSRKCTSLKFTEELCIMTMMQNLKRNWLVVSKLTWRIWRILTRALKSHKNLQLNGLFLNKVYSVWAKKVGRSYVWWHWILMQNLKENWLVLSKTTWGIRQIFTSWKVAILF